MRSTTIAPLLLLCITGSVQAEQQENGMEDYTIRQGPCFRVRVDQGNDDDGNAYFYNGAYRSQYQRYISYSLCEKNNDDSCTEYVTDLESYLGVSVDYVQTYCGVCAAQCGRRRWLEDQQEDEEEEDGDDGGANWNVDCSQCAEDCTLLQNNNNNDGMDESQYLDCAQAAAGGDDDGVEYYTAPQCENGAVVIGHFYDDECTIKTSTLQDADFSYNTFHTMEATPIQCALDEDACADLFGDDSVYCGEDRDEGDEDESLCKAAKAAGRVYTFYKKPIYKKLHLGALAVLLAFIASVFGFLAYTYYVRHSRTQTKTPMADLDNGAATADLPALS